MNINEIIAIIDAPDPMGMPPIMALPNNIAKLTAEQKLEACKYYSQVAYDLIKSTDLKAEYEEVRCGFYDGADLLKKDDKEIVSLGEVEKMLLIASALTTSGPYNNSQEEAKAEFDATEAVLASLGLVFTDSGKASFDELLESINTGVMTQTYALYQSVFGVYAKLQPCPEVNQIKAALSKAVNCLHGIGDKEKNMRKMAVTAAFMVF